MPDSQATVFVLGAGASAFCGFPLGKELKSQLLEVAAANRVRRAMEHLGISESLTSRFSDALRYGPYTTIDEMLNKKPKYRQLGALLIAETILLKEDHGGLLYSKGWYGKLYSLLNLTSTESRARDLSIVTLNYDRSLEWFFHHYIDHATPDDEMDLAYDNWKLVRVIHAHGSLGSIETAPYGVRDDSHVALIKAAEQIKIVGDNLEDSDLFVQAKKVIREANNVVFLGIGYHPVTLDALLSDAANLHKQYYGTAHGLESKRIDDLRERFGPAFKPTDLNIDQYLATVFSDIWGRSER